MKTIKGLFAKIIDFENLYEAWDAARKGKRYRAEVMKFSSNLESNLIDIQNHLIYGTYRVGRYRPFFVYEPKKRLVMALPFRDRVVQWAIYRQLFPLIEKQFIDDSYACRRGKGTHKAADKLQYWLRQTDRKKDKYYYLKLDISKYFYRVDHAVLIDLLRRKIRDGPLLSLLVTIINSEDTHFGLPVGCDPDAISFDEWLDDVGMPIGNLTSQMFANMYLNEVDQYIKHELKIKYYARYLDDSILILHTKQEARFALEKIRTFLKEKLKLELNSKTQIFKGKQGVNFCGYKINEYRLKLRNKGKRKLKDKVKSLKRKIKNGEMNSNEAHVLLAGNWGYVKWANIHNLEEKLFFIEE